MLDVSLTGDQQRPGPGLMTNVVSNERAFGAMTALASFETHEVFSGHFGHLGP